MKLGDSITVNGKPGKVLEMLSGHQVLVLVNGIKRTVFERSLEAANGK